MCVGIKKKQSEKNNNSRKNNKHKRDKRILNGSASGIKTMGSTTGGGKGTGDVSPNILHF